MPKLRNFKVMKEGKQYLGKTYYGVWVAGIAQVTHADWMWMLIQDQDSAISVSEFASVYEIVE